MTDQPHDRPDSHAEHERRVFDSLLSTTAVLHRAAAELAELLPATP